jgi:hypothetical protein
VLVQVAWEESFGIVMIEKIASGNPAVCGGAVPEVVVSSVTDLVCEGSDNVAGAIARARTADPANLSAGRLGSGYDQTDQEVARKVIKSVELQRNRVGTVD